MRQKTNFEKQQEVARALYGPDKPDRILNTSYVQEERDPSDAFYNVDERRRQKQIDRDQDCAAIENSDYIYQHLNSRNGLFSAFNLSNLVIVSRRSRRS
jgi:hypothetical protein